MASAFGKAVVIGLGGSGQKALIRIKKMFLEHCGDKLPPCIKLLAFDTSSNQEHVYNAQGKKITFDNDEFYHLRVGSVRQAIKSEYVQKWWIPYEPLDRATVNEGSGGIRQVGRLAVFVNIDSVKQRIAKAFSDIDQFGGDTKMAERGMELLGITPQVYVVGSFAGGTGSGSFVDFSILCRSLGGLDMFYSAFFVMPWIYRNCAKTAYENGYAALLELEQLNNCSPKEPYTVQYSPDSKLEFSLEDRPYHIVNLIDGKCRNGYKIQEHKELSEFIGECIFNSVGAIGEQAADVVNNIMNTINISQPSDWQNRRALYSTFGTSSIVYPGAEIHERASIKYACDLIDEAMRHIKAPATLPSDEINDKEVGPFIVEKGLEPDQHGLLKRILPQDALGVYIMDDEMGLRDPNLKSIVKDDLNRWEKRQLNECQRKIKDNGEEIKKDVIRDSKALLDQIAANEKTGNRSKGSYEAANKLFFETWSEAQNKLTVEKEKQTQELDIAQEKLASCSAAFPDPPARFPYSTNPARIAYRNYADTMMEVLSHRINVQRLEKAIELYATWVKETKRKESEIGKSLSERGSVHSKLTDLKSALITRRAGLSNANLLKRKSLFEIYVGVITEDEKDVIYVREEKPLPSASTDFGEFLKANKITDRNSLNELNAKRLDAMFMEYSRQRLKPATDVSVLEVLEELEKKKEGTITGIMQQAMRNSSLLLPIDNDKLAGKENLLAEFTVIGGQNREALANLLKDVIPKNPQVQNLWASTGDKHRITICNYFAVVPLHLLKDIREIRSSYLERIYPPAHTDVNFEFKLKDVLPESYIEVHTLKLLSLAILDSVGLIKRVQRRDGSKFYCLDAQVIGRENFVDEEDLQLPGKPGKFYSLYEEVCKDTTLQDKLEQTLLTLDRQNQFHELLMESMKSRLEEFRANINTKEFHKMITGNIYYQQAAFYRDMLKNKWSVAEALGL